MESPKKFVFVFVFVFFAGSSPAQQPRDGFWQTVKRAAVASLPRVDFPAVRNITQGSIFSGSHDTVVLTNVTTKVVVVSDNGKPVAILPPGTRWVGKYYGGYGGNHTLVADVYNSTVRIVNDAPAWTQDAARFKGDALTPDFLTGNPPAKEVKVRVDRLKKAVEKDLGGKARAAELDEWFKLVQEQGVVTLQPVAYLATTPAYNVYVGGYNYGYGNYRSYALRVVVGGSRSYDYRITY